MNRTLLVITPAAVVAVAILGPVLAAVAAVLGLTGSALHELIHYVTAVAVGKEDVRVGWDAIGPYVSYEGDVSAIVQLAPPLTALAATVWLASTTAFPEWSQGSVLAGAFLAGLHSLSPTDYAPVFERSSTDV